MINNEEIVDDLNDLVKINNDRIHGYEEAIKESKDAQLNDLFRHMIIQSEQFRSQLADHIVRIDGKAVADFESTDLTSQLHRAWIDIKSAITGKDREAILGSVEFGENAAVEAYQDAVEKDHLPAYIKEDLRKQLTELKNAYDRVKTLEKAA
ncbi:PA2169 family four-helix-bundle protein [Spirosoma daeguense]